MIYSTFLSDNPNITGAEFIAQIGGAHSINQRDEEGISPIEAAIFARNIEVADAIIATNGFDVDAKSEAGFTALNFAAQYCLNSNIMELLIEAGANVNTEDDWGQTPLFWALQKHQWHGEVPDFVPVAKSKVMVLIAADATVKESDLRVLEEQVYHHDEIHQRLEQALLGQAPQQDEQEHEA